MKGDNLDQGLPVSYPKVVDFEMVPGSGVVGIMIWTRHHDALGQQRARETRATSTCVDR
jgi:hypothetical protein